MLLGHKEMKTKPLTPEEERIIVHKGTEMPFTGKYVNHKEKGTYVCKRCNAPLYRSEDKFDSLCGWPSFDDEIPGAVKRIADADDQRTEISCANCNAHLGHLFLGEEMTKKNTRHCVNSISMNFVPTESQKKTERAIFAAGCFWGVEYYFKKTKGILSTSVGYTGGQTENPDYQEVCYLDTGHVEAVEVIFDPTVTSYEELAKLFFEIHDPTQINRQGPDIGEQYRSEIFYLNHNQKIVAEKLIKRLEDKGVKIATQVTEAATFWPAEEVHQDYYAKTGHAPYCNVLTKRF